MAWFGSFASEIFTGGSKLRIKISELRGQRAEWNQPMGPPTAQKLTHRTARSSTRLCRTATWFGGWCVDLQLLGVVPRECIVGGCGIAAFGKKRVEKTCGKTSGRCELMIRLWWCVEPWSTMGLNSIRFECGTLPALLDCRANFLSRTVVPRRRCGQSSKTNQQGPCL